jgi:hypothetical protein
MSEIARRSESTVRDGDKDVAPTDTEKKRELDIDTDEEREIGLEAIRPAATKEEGKTQGEKSDNATSTRAKSLRSIHSHRSYAASDGYTHFKEEEDRPNISSGVTADEPFLVTWDGDSDPMNPRSMTKLRRWLIVLIVSSSSLCV